MSLYGMMRTGSSGMNAQANRLSTVADNIANSSTTGYKTASTEFSSLLLPSTNGSYNSGAVDSDVRHAIQQQGALTYTSSDTDLAINGNGFFVVQNDAGQPYLTRAGSFVPNADGELVNAGGYKLLGYPYTTEPPTPVVNGFNGLVPVTIGTNKLVATASTAASFSANLNSSADILDPASTDYALPNNTTNADPLDSPVKYTSKSSLKAFDTLGNQVLLDLYYTKTDVGTWDVSVYKQADADPTTGGFPYIAADGTSDTPLVTDTLTFDSGTGRLDDTSVSSLTIPGGTIDNMPDDFTFDLSNMTQLSYPFTLNSATVDGNAPSQVDKVQIDNDGTVFAQYQNGDLIPIYRIAMANVASPDQLNVVSGNVYSQSTDSGVVVLGFPGSGGFGSITSGALESSNVDLAEELTRMIESQRTYTANSKVFQTGSDLLDVLVNLKR